MKIHISKLISTDQAMYFKSLAKHINFYGPQRGSPKVAAHLFFTVLDLQIHFALTVALTAPAFVITAKPRPAYPLMEERGICGISVLHAL